MTEVFIFQYRPAKKVNKPLLLFNTRRICFHNQALSRSLDQVKNELGTTLKGKIFHCAQVKGISLEIAKNRGGCSGKVALPRNRGNPGVIIKSKGDH